MNVNKQLVNLVGAVVVVAVLVAGVVLIAVPMFSQAQTTDRQTSTVAQTNAVYQTQIDALSSANDDIETIDGNLAALRTAIAAAPQLDDVFEIIAAAAETQPVTIESVAVAEPESFVARAAVVDATGLGVPVPAPVDSSEPTDAAVEGDSGTGDADGDAASDPAPVDTPTATDAAAGPQLQIPVTITVQVPDAATAAAFLDALRVGPRFLLPIDNALSDGTLTVQALTFIRTEN